jgi:hypothetical protein
MNSNNNDKKSVHQKPSIGSDRKITLKNNKIRRRLISTNIIKTKHKD